MGATVLGLGYYVPAEAVPNAPIAQRIGVEDAWDREADGDSVPPARCAR